MPATWELHKGTKVLRIDYSGLSGLEFLTEIKRMEQFIMNSGKEGILELVDFSNAVADMSAFEELKRISKRTGPIIDKIAVLGVSGIKKALLDSYARITKRKNLKTFKSEEEALDWLVS